jgi:hypothetical protein
LATLGFDVAVANVACGERCFASNNADLRHTKKEFRMSECYLNANNLANLSGGLGFWRSEYSNATFMPILANKLDFLAFFC